MKAFWLRMTVSDVFLGSFTDRITSSLISSLASVSSTWEIISSPAVIQNTYVSQFLFRSRLQVLFLNACYPHAHAPLSCVYPCWCVPQDGDPLGNKPALKGTCCIDLHRPELHPQPQQLQVNTHAHTQLPAKEQTFFVSHVWQIL